MVLTVDPGASPTHSATIVTDATLMSTNETILVETDILIPQPDLSLYEEEDVTRPINAWWEASSPETNIYATIYNQGNADVSDVQVEFETSEWGINREWTAVASTSIPSISAGDSQVASVTIPQSQVNNIRVSVYSESAEWNEYNNIGTKCIKRYDIQAGGSVDVVIPIGNEAVRGTDTVSLEVDASSVPSGGTQH